MRTFTIYTLGCKVNQYESAQIRQFLEENGLKSVKPDEKPDLFVINTCCVTATASAKSRQFIQKANKLNQKAFKVVCGCLTELKTNELQIEKSKSTHFLAGRETLASQLHKIIGGARFGCSLTSSTNTSDIAQYPHIKPDVRPKINSFADLTSLPKLPLLTAFKEQTRAFLKVQDGCDGICSYCIIPKIRPVVRSKPIFEAISEAKALVSAGHKEIVVTGVNLGAYGQQSVRKTEDRGRKTEDRGQIADCGFGSHVLTQSSSTRGRRSASIADLLEELAEVEGLKRIRVSSLEPGDISEELLDVFCRHPNIMPHIHLSVQSGSDNILRRMCRQYGAEELREKIALIKSRLDRPAITCDIIVGFPGETEEDFQQTVELAKWAGFSKMHIFPFSARAGTAAAKMKERVQPKVVKERAEVLSRLGDCLGRQFREQFIGEECEVLLENDEPMSGRCERYFLVKVNSKKQIVKSEFGLATEIFSHRGHRDHRDKNEKQIYNNLVPLCLGGKGEIVKVKITGATGEGTTAEAANSKY